MVSKYIVKKIEYKMHSSFFAGAPHDKATIFILRDSKHKYNFDVLEKFANSHFHIIDISNISPQILNDRNAYLRCSGSHYGFHSCVLKIFASRREMDDGWPCHFQNYTTKQH